MTSLIVFNPDGKVGITKLQGGILDFRLNGIGETFTFDFYVAHEDRVDVHELIETSATLSAPIFTFNASILGVEILCIESIGYPYVD